MARASTFIPQSGPERNPERELSPRRGEGFKFKPEEPNNHQKMTKRMYAHPWEKGLRGASEKNTSNHSNQCTNYRSTDEGSKQLKLQGTAKK